MKYRSKKIISKNSDKTITSVLLGSYIRAMLISLLLGFFFFVAITGKEMVYRQNLDNSRILDTFSYFINMQLEDIRKFSYNLVIEEGLQSRLDETGEGKIKQISTFLMNKMAERSEIQSIHIIMEDGAVSEYKQPTFGQDPQELLQRLDIENLKQGKSSYYWEIGKDSAGDQGINTFYLVSSIRSKKSLQHLGYLIVFLDPNLLQKSFDFYLREVGYEVLIKSESGNMISFPAGGEIETYSGKLNFDESPKSLWRLFSTRKYSSQPMESIRGEIYGMTKNSIFRANIEFALIFMLIITMEFIIIVSIIIKKRVTGPLEEIAKRARDIGIQGNLDILFSKEKYYSEADDISKALNEMMEQIKTLIVEVKRREKLQKGLELSVINHQIKPHFLYNTLNAASILISVEEKESANQLIKSLARYYRACLNQGNDMITLTNELEISQEYIKIALIRNPDILRVSYDIDEECREILIPKMTIQTLVENSIKYGIKQMGEPVYVTISAKADGDFTQLCVADNGSGMKKDTIDKVMKGEPLEVQSGFGVKSVVSRISLSYDIKNIADIIAIESKEGEYTKVFLKIPFKAGEKDEE
ncbi:histidine kinase/DNA gyrase B/HSP90-like ATPase [Kineothrix alysoides]|uniref:Histidine kinase/DNA gyrase B/HSP90-like ATPase n=2 Tax=Kineothrix alysoides TaxID=1469948 RepID=A0A4R1QS70_9FIRM|nr:histidine kinase/DNA gyrase B/HSP90-like ATPase [Kineothrix alysoides]